MTTVTMYDAVTPSNIPTNAQAVAGYINGLYAWKATDWARFPNALKKTISITAAANAGDVLDVENGDATVAQAPGWIKMRQASGLTKPTIYTSASNVPALQTACHGLNYWIWTAHYTMNAHIEPGSVATQYADYPTVDLSLCDTIWWNQEPPTASATYPTPAPNKSVVGMAHTPDNKGYWLVQNDGGVFSHGDAPFKGSLPQTNANVTNIVGIEAHPNGQGYWLVGSDGGVFSYNVPFFGSLGGKTLSAPIVRMVVTSTGNGYWLLSKDGGVFSFGDAAFEGAGV